MPTVPAVGRTGHRLAAAGSAGAAAVAGSYAVTGWERSFVAAPVDALVVRLTPGRVVAFMIQNVGDEAHLLHVGLALVATAGLFGLAGLAGLAVADRTDSRAVGAGLAGALALAAGVGLVGSPASAAGAAAPTAAVVGLAGLRPTAPPLDTSKRRTLGAAAGGLAALAGAVGAGRYRSGGGGRTRTAGVGGADERLADAEGRQLETASEALPGLVSPIDGFYNVDIAEFDPQLDAGDWSLTFTGEVTGDRLTVDYEALLERPVEHRFVTLRCVGEDLNGRKLDTALWTGTPIGPLLSEVDPDGACGCVMLRGEDGYSVQFPAGVLADGVLAWGMNGRALPESHGHPVRVLVPGHWGETNVKWLTEIEALDREADGYWEQRGWEGTGTVNTVAKLWDEGITRLDDGRVELAGHAYAGTRGVDRVEVSVDGGDTWTAATLSDPLPDADVWRQYRHRFEPDGPTEVVVRAVDGRGVPQAAEESGSFPSGASGRVSRTVDP